MDRDAAMTIFLKNIDYLQGICIFAIDTYWVDMKEKRNREEIVTAFKQSVTLRAKWEEAIASGADREEMEKMGLKTIEVQL